MGQAYPNPSEFEGEKGTACIRSTNDKDTQYVPLSTITGSKKDQQLLKNQSKTEIVVKEMSKKEPEQAEIYICNIYTNSDDTVTHLCWGISRT